ncbi:MAG: porin family protein [Endomicrobiaceae bacterium]|nr:porin family protein [Endomicrobiaceae bacterium]
MKKLLAAMFLAAVTAVPAFALAELDLKVGYIVEPTVVQTSQSEYKVGYSQDPSYSIGADCYLYLLNNIGIGAGLSYIFDSKFDGHLKEDAKLGSTNAFVALKPILAEDGLVDKVYLLGQLGVGFTKYNDNKEDFLENGLYWGVGFGLEKWNFIVELLYSVNYWKHNTEESGDLTFSNRRLAMNVGFKFGI